MERLFNRFVVKRRILIVDGSDVKKVLSLLHNNLSDWHQGVRVCEGLYNNWCISLLATNDEWDVISDELRKGDFVKILYKRKGYYKI